MKPLGFWITWTLTSVLYQLIKLSLGFSADWAACFNEMWWTGAACLAFHFRLVEARP